MLPIIRIENEKAAASIKNKGTLLRSDNISWHYVEESGWYIVAYSSVVTFVSKSMFADLLSAPVDKSEGSSITRDNVLAKCRKLGFAEFDDYFLYQDDEGPFRCIRCVPKREGKGHFVLNEIVETLNELEGARS